MWIQAIRDAISLGQGFLCHGDAECEAVSVEVECCCFFVPWGFAGYLYVVGIFFFLVFRR